MVVKLVFVGVSASEDIVLTPVVEGAGITVGLGVVRMKLDPGGVQMRHPVHFTENCRNCYAHKEQTRTEFVLKKDLKR